MGAAEASEPGVLERRFRDALAKLRAAASPRRWLVAFSGGLDSTLLLHLLARSRPAEAVVAVHVDHGLHPDSARWSAHCARVAAGLAVAYVARSVSVAQTGGGSPEAAARRARYAALAEQIAAGDVLLTAHHADDQLETVLLRLVRGTGVRGLTAIHRTRPFAAGLLARPLLGFTRAEIRAQAAALALDWLEDPSNEDSRYDRNYLRRECLPPLTARWPQAGLLADRLAQQAAEAEAVLGEVAESDLAAAVERDRLPVADLVRLSGPRLNNALRHAVRRLDLPVPNAAQLAELRRALTARRDAETQVSWPGGEARLYRGHLYLLAPLALPAADRGLLQPGRILSLPYGALGLVAATDYGIPDRFARTGLEVRFRTGGERFRPHPGRCSKPLKQWFQEAGIVPWLRAAVPLLYHGDDLVAVADLCLASSLPQTAADAPFWRPVWTNRPRLH